MVEVIGPGWALGGTCFLARTGRLWDSSGPHARVTTVHRSRTREARDTGGVSPHLARKISTKMPVQCADGSPLLVFGMEATPLGMNESDIEPLSPSQVRRHLDTQFYRVQPSPNTPNRSHFAVMPNQQVALVMYKTDRELGPSWDVTELELWLKQSIATMI